MGTMITLKASDGFSLGAYEMKPEGTPHGAVIVIQEIFGVNEHIKRVADGYAMDGYYALSPAIFDRGERNVELGYDKPDVDKGIALRAKIPMETTLLDVAAAVEAAGSTGKVAIVGFCYGGSLAWMSAARTPGLSAAVGYYGGMIARHLDEKPRVPVMLHFGEQDGGIPMSDVEKVKAAADPAKVEVYTYPAGHAFNREGNQAYVPHCAMLARMRTARFLERTIG